MNGAPPARAWCAALGALEGWPWAWSQSALHRAPGAPTHRRACLVSRAVGRTSGTHVPTDAHSHIEACWVLEGTRAPRTHVSLYKAGYLHGPARPPTAGLLGAAATAAPTTYAPTTATPTTYAPTTVPPTLLPSPSPATAPTPPPAAGMRTGLGVSTSRIRHVHRHAARACNVYLCTHINQGHSHGTSRVLTGYCTGELVGSRYRHRRGAD
jgi:hypothetical protein